MIFAEMDIVGYLPQARLAGGILFNIIYDLLDTSIIIGELVVIDHATIISN
jgi:hypothetical protein